MIDKGTKNKTSQKNLQNFTTNVIQESNSALVPLNQCPSTGFFITEVDERFIGTLLFQAFCGSLMAQVSRST